MKCIICMLVQLNILCLICINLQYPQNCIEFDSDAWVLLNFYSKYSIKKGQSLTHMVSPDEIQHARSKNECLPSECWREENISFKALGLWFLSLFQNLVRRTLSVQPGAKINSVYYCQNVLEQGLLPAIRRISNNDFVFKQDGAPCTPFTTLSLTCIPMCLSSFNQKTGRRTVRI